MNKRLLSMFLALCMIVSMLPVSAMAEEIHTTIGGSGEIISFAPLTEIAKAVSLGTSIEDLELPETLTATVRTAVLADENSTQDSDSPETTTPTTATEPKWKETTGDIPVTWDSPDYDPNTGGEYVFSPVIVGYTVSATLPEIKVTVGAAMLIDKTQAREKPTLTAQSEETRDFYIVLVGDRMCPSSLGFLSNDCGLSPISTADSDDYAPDDDGNAMVKSYLYRAAVGQTITFHWGLGEDGFRGLLYAYYADDEPTLDATFGAQWAVLRNSGLIGFATGDNQPIGLQFEVAASPVLSKPDAVTNYDIWVGGVQVTSANASNVLDDGTVTYDSDTNTLTLNDANITSVYTLSAARYGIYAPDGLNLKLVGTNVITLGSGDTAYGICSADHDLQISAEHNGSLTVTTNGNFGIYSDNLTINSGEITAVSAVIWGTESVSISEGTVTSTGGVYGIVAPRLTVSGGTVTASGSTYALHLTNAPDFKGMQVTASLNENGTPVAAYDVANLSTYKYIKVEPGATPPVLSEVGDRTALQSAITDAAGDLDLKLSDSFSYSDTGTIIIDCDYNITIDLNGKTLDGGSLPAIRHQGTGTLTIIDSKGGGIITGKTISGTIRVNNGGTVNINGGTVNATAGTNNIAMWVGFNSILNINGGTVSATGLAGNAIYTQNATLNITGGTISATGNDGYAIYSEVGSSQLLNISGGTISAAGTPRDIAIFNQNTAIKTGKTIIIQGRTKAMEYAPTLDGGVQVMARTNYDGSGSGDYNSESIATYKYLKFGLDIIPPELSSGSVDRTSDTAATIGFTTDKAGTAYYLVVNSGASAPTSMAVKAGTSLGSVSGTVTGKAVTLTAGAKDIYVVVEDSAGNISTTLKIPAAAYVAPPVLSAGNVQRASDTAATIGFTTDKAGTAYYLVVNSGTSAPTSAEVKAGTSLGSVSGPVAGKAVTLTAGAKDIYVVVEDSEDNISAPLKIAAVAYVPPVLSAGSVQRTSDTAATIGFTTDKIGIAYYLVVNSGESAPTNAEVTRGVFLGFVSGTVTGQAVTLTAGAQDIYVIVFDEINISAPLKIEAAAYVAPPVNASISPDTATFDLNPNGANHTDIAVTLTPGSYELNSIKNGGVPLLILADYTANGGGSYTLKKSYLSSLGEGNATITFQMSGGTNPTLTLTVEDTRIALTSVSISDTTPTFGDTLSATIEPSAATVTYSWKADGAQVSTGTTYEVKAADIGKAITLTVTGTQGYKGAATSPATSAVVARDYSVTVDSSKSVAQGLGVSSLPTADAGSVTGTLTWYSNSGRTIAAVDTDISALSIGGSVTLYWSFTATTTGYVTTPKTGECVVTIVSGAAQTLSFAQSTVTKTVGDPIFTNVLTHSVGTGAVTYSSSNTGVATVHPTTGVVAIVGAGTTTITANAAMVPGEYAPGSASFTLTVNAPAKSVSVGPQIGTATAGTAGSLTYTVTTANIADGTYAVSVANLPAGVTIGNSGNVTISGNSGTLTLTVADTAAAGTTGTLALTLDGATSAAFSIVIGEPAPATTHTVTFNPNGGTVSETSRSVAPGTAVGALPTPTRSGSYSFDGWYTAASGGTQISAGTTVSANVTYYAHWTYTGGGGSGSGGGSSSNDNSSPVIVTPPAPDKPNSPTQGEIKVPGTVDGKGNVTVSITDKTVTDAFNKALAEAKKNGTEQNGITVVLRVDTGNKAGSNVTVNLPKAVQDTIIAKKIVNTIVVVDNPDIRVGMDLATVQEINKQAKSDVNITATRTNSGKLTGEAKKAIGSRPVFDLKVNYGNGKAVSSFGAGSVSVTIPYTLGANEKAGNVQAVYVDSKGKVHWLVNSVYDSVEKVLRFSTDHFSTYGIGYKQANTAFTDIAGHWAKEDIEFVASRGLFSGTSETKFSPNTAMTRGMFVTALGRLANADVSGYAKSSFSDVKDDAYYMGYIEWASKNNIVNGVGNGKFAPDQSITREQMAVIMSNYAKTIGCTLPKVHVENIFADNGKISTYAKEAVKQMQMAGVISGKNGNLFDPQGTATRAEVSAVLRRFVELAISSDTAQGWSMNDSGKWMYFKNGKPLTGKQDIDGATYTFDQYGVTADVPKNLRYTTYTVQKGDSFWSISRKLGCPMSELERLNNKSRFSLIIPGDVLRVPEK